MDQEEVSKPEGMVSRGKVIAVLSMRVVYTLVSLILGLIAMALMGSAVYEVWLVLGDTSELVPALLDAVALLVIGMAVFDVSKFLVEEEVFSSGNQVSEGGQRNTLIKFLVIINIAMLMEALVFVFTAAKEDISLLVYPTFLLIGSVLLVLGLGIYQKLTEGAGR
ncbi:hypothetical protein SAMN05660831_02411 [Thiohalospira halophila DSM 15071]|uniref:General glycosylation pathway protein n=1 Tax=Thiohalospira halophila DSM 15071 TaxID=1123397 RepID=A0A1I1VQI9_9GAMM|nr:hypothetical protein [Thiohalospira halophila]SFD84298.1 hypothetical protein SAMN05660831_02411 [Thiohalospira halophila DSM 15071]